MEKEIKETKSEKEILYAVKATDKDSGNVRIVWNFTTPDKAFAISTAKVCNKEYGDETTYEVISSDKDSDFNALIKK